jgi:hypothetical protein
MESLSDRSGRARLGSCSPRRRSGGGSADTLAKPALSTGSLHQVGGSYTCERVEATRPKGRRSRAALPRILTPWSSTPSSQTRSIRCLSSAEAESTLETVLEDEPEWRDTLYIECVEFVTGRTELARRRRSAARADDLIAPPPTTRPLVVRRHLVAGDVVLGNRMGAPVREGGGVVAPCVNSLRMCKAGS